MSNVEALREVKRVEDDVRRQKEESRRQAADILRKARADVAEIEARAKADADAAYQAEIDRVAKGVADEKAKIHRAGAGEADKIVSAGSGPSLGQAVDLILKRFNDKIRG